MQLNKQQMKIGGIVIAVIILLMILKTISGSGTISSISDAVDAASELTVGSFEITINSTEETEDDIVAYPIFKISGYTDGTKYIASLSLDKDNEITESGEVLLINDENIYINSVALNKFVSNALDLKARDIDKSDGTWVAVATDFSKENKLAYKELFDLIETLIVSGISDTEQTTEDTFFTVNVTDNEAIANIYNNIVSFIGDNRESFASVLSNIGNTLNLKAKTDLYKKLAKTSKSLSETEYINIFIDNMCSEFTTIANNSSSTKKDQLVSYSASYTSTEDNTDAFSQNLVFKYATEEKIKNYNIAYTFIENENVNIADIDAKDFASSNATKIINDIFKDLIKYDYTDLLELDFTEDDIYEFDVIVKDDLIICSDINETYTRKVIYITNNDDVEEAVTVILTNNSTIEAAFEDYYSKNGYSKRTIKSSLASVSLDDVNKSITDEIDSTLANNVLKQNCVAYVATTATLKSLNDSITTIDNFVLSLKGGE